jgi:hypothetical protein
MLVPNFYLWRGEDRYQFADHCFATFQNESWSAASCWPISGYKFSWGKPRITGHEATYNCSLNQRQAVQVFRVYCCDRQHPGRRKLTDRCHLRRLCSVLIFTLWSRPAVITTRMGSLHLEYTYSIFQFPRWRHVGLLGIGGREILNYIFRK